MATKVRRLFEQFQPSHYDLSLQLDPEAMAFSGTVMISGKKVGRPSQRLTFHQQGLQIAAAKITRHDKVGQHDIPVARINRQATYDEVRLHTASKLFPGNYQVELQFSGKITKQMEGIYPCFFTQDGKPKKLIATQFESHDARQAFPCIDEPEAKASFDLTLETPKTKTVLANTPIKKQQATKTGLSTSFETTPIMSTYLLAFVFGDLDYLERKTKDGVLVRTYATAANVQHTEFALDVAVRCLEFYNDYFAIPYPLPKCDFIALPDFASGAMENWGCITFREQTLLVDPANTSLQLKQHVANVVAHELTHQWFGNLVTMRWWNDLWLNESFASWMSYLAIDHLFPSWKVWTQFVVEEQGLALRQDALQNTHPIEVAVNHPDEIRTIFDAISYEKGASVLNMLHSYLGADDFQGGLQLYLKRHAYANTASTDLWAAWEETSHKPVGEFMGRWTATAGYPIVHANLAGAAPALKQERFYLNPAADKQPATWPIPLLANAPLGIETLEKPEHNLQASNITPETLLNQNRAAFFRAVYDAKHLGQLANAVKAGKLNDLDRLGLLADAFEAAKAGYGSTVEALKLLEAYGHEDSVVVWEIIAGAISSIRGVMDDESLRQALKPFVIKLVKQQLDRLGWREKPGDSHFDLLLRPIILSLAAGADEPSVVSEALSRFKAMKRPEDIAPDIRGIVYGTVARNGGQPEFDKLLKLHHTSQSSEERVTLAGALTNFEYDSQIKQALAIITTDNVRLQDTMYWVAYSFMNRFARRQTWQWLQQNWGWLQKNLGTDLSFYRMPNYAGRAFSDASFLPEFTKFFEARISPAFERPVKQAIETIEWQSAWKTRDLNALKKYFKA